jgi:hypothetical protein
MEGLTQGVTEQPMAGLIDGPAHYVGHGHQLVTVVFPARGAAAMSLPRAVGAQATS